MDAEGIAYRRALLADHHLLDRTCFKRLRNNEPSPPASTMDARRRNPRGAHGCAIVLRKHLFDKAILVLQKLWHAVSFLACFFRRAALGGTAGALVGRSGLPEAWKVDG